ncbi:MAG TPA: hypothetical protein VGZ29_13435 [Terriglobia bacterium]|nr:hypothetical protein [Terriglobia bacterium]
MKRSLCCLAISAALIASAGRFATAQDVKPMPVPSLDWIIATRPVPGTLAIAAPAPHHQAPPSSCQPCLFYGGDINPGSPEVNGFGNENTLLVQDTTLYAPFTVPGGQRWRISGLFTNNLADPYEGIDPRQATWSISMGMSSGNAGTVVASGTATASFTATGRNAFGFNEYTVGVAFATPAVVLRPGTYWLSVVPQCTNSGNSNCYGAQYFVSNTGGLNSYGPQEPTAKSFWNSAYFGYTYANACAVNTDGCEKFSAGVEGTVEH